MTPIAARSAAERYVADLLLECQAIADLFEDRPQSVTCKSGSLIPLGNDLGQIVAGQTADVTDQPAAILEIPGNISQDSADVVQDVKRQLVSNQLDPDKLKAWLQGAYMPSGLQKSQCPFVQTLMNTPAVKPHAPVPPGQSCALFSAGSPSGSSSGLDETSRPSCRPKAQRPFSAAASSQSSPSGGPGGASAFFWGSGGDGVQHGDGGLAQRRYDGDKPTLTGEWRESETHRLRRLLDPRYRRCPANYVGDVANTDDRDGAHGRARHPEPPLEECADDSLPQLEPPHKQDSAHSNLLQRGSAGPQPVDRLSNASAQPTDVQRLYRPTLTPKTTVAPKAGARSGRPQSGRRQSDPDKPKLPLVSRQVDLAEAPPESHDPPQMEILHCVMQKISKHVAPGKSKIAPKRMQLGPSNFEKWREKDEAHRRKRLDSLKKHAAEKEEREREDAKKINAFDESVKSMFRKEKTTVGFGEMKLEVSVPMTDLQRLAHEKEMSLDDIFLVRGVFESYDTDASGSLDIKEFDNAVGKLLLLQLGEEATADRVDSLTGWHWWDSDVDKTGTINFKEFLDWYASNGFNEELLISEDQRELRKIAKANGVHLDSVERIKEIFNSVDEDGSGEVELGEFSGILHKCLKVPPNHWVPESRVQYFWSQIDTDGSGKITFSEFFRWWLRNFDEKYFHLENKHDAPFEAFYKQVRRIGPDFLDPPPVMPAQAPPADPVHDVAEDIFGHLQEMNAQTAMQRHNKKVREFRYTLKDSAGKTNDGVTCIPVLARTSMT